MAKFIKYTKPSLSEVGKPALNPVEEVIISVDDIRSMSHNNGGYFVSTRLMDKVYCGTQVIAEDNLIIKVSKEDYEMTKQLLLESSDLETEMRFLMKIKGPKIDEFLHDFDTDEICINENKKDMLGLIVYCRDLGAVYITDCLSYAAMRSKEHLEFLQDILNAYEKRELFFENTMKGGACHA